MIHSMTGYGRGIAKYNGADLVIELRSVNRSSLEISSRFPQDYQFLELVIRKIIQKKLFRGQINVSIQEGIKNKNNVFKVDEEVFGETYAVFNKLKKKFKMESNISFGDILRIEGVVIKETPKENQKALTNAAEKALNTALDNLINMRIEEGKSLCKDMLNRIEIINSILKGINKIVPDALEKYKKSLEYKMKSLMPEGIKIDDARFYTELAIYAEKVDITEEIVRLESHINLFKDTLEKNNSIGKKLDFILQEMNREANTMGSKASDSSLTKEVINIKNEIEKIREQVQNVE
ncbi:MAG: YicC family protein [bacterium]|nr:YicC family protein [bacterium]